MYFIKIDIHFRQAVIRRLFQNWNWINLDKNLSIAKVRILELLFSTNAGYDDLSIRSLINGFCPLQKMSWETTLTFLSKVPFFFIISLQLGTSWRPSNTIIPIQLTIDVRIQAFFCSKNYIKLVLSAFPFWSLCRCTRIFLIVRLRSQLQMKLP